ncbi:LysR family transcriptional regulator [Asticcacaulis endophyticus]|uniref:LysR family transcriptional regulator n=2 Tax=Asticcacaulis endophyticus TaxID=1395890 RepID=A0A918USV7_9CAUL|nr:LysR family transcriptional regulator [Asticcacaulis endophyticus]
MTERHVTRAGDRIGLTQSGVSHALSRLRALLADPLFVRPPKGMMPTQAAIDMADDVHALLEHAQSLLTPRSHFDPATSERVFRLGLSDYAAFILLPALTRHLSRLGSDIGVSVVNANHTTGLPLLDADGAELIVGNFPPSPAHMNQIRLFQEDFVCAARQGHPELRVAGMSIDVYRQARHVQVSSKGEMHGYIDGDLKATGIVRNVKVTVGHFLMAPFMVVDSELIATEPLRLLTAFTKTHGLVLYEAPVAMPSFDVVMAWHKKNDADPGHQWLREQIQNLAITNSV